MGLKMANKKNISSNDKISEGTLHEILLDIKYRLDHLEDIEADNRALIVSKDFTFEAWVYPTDLKTSGYGNIIFGQENNFHKD